MNNTNQKSASTARLALFSLAMVLLSIFFFQPAFVPSYAQDTPGRGVGGFLDEDGDGFNDLMPDSDGDGVPDAIDPDFRGHRADSSFMHQHMYGHGDSSGMMYRMMGDEFGHMEMHGEPGMYGPGDSTMHGMHGDSSGHHGGGGMGGDGGMDPDSGGMGGGGGMGPAPGKIGDGDKYIPPMIEIIREGDKESQKSVEGSK